MKRETWLNDTTLVAPLVKRTEAAFTRLRDLDETNLSLYYAVPGEVAAPRTTAPGAQRAFSLLDSVAEAGDNLMLEIADAAEAQVASRPLQCKVNSTGGEADDERRCDLMSLLVNGVFEASHFTYIATRAYKDGELCWGGPALGWYDEASHEIKFSRLLPEQVYWVEDGTEKPRVMFTVTPVPRANLIARFPEHRARLEDAKTWAPKPMPGVDSLVPISEDADTLKTIEIWCTQLGDGSTPEAKGKHAIVVEDIALMDEAYEETEHQIIAFKWAPDHKGYAGKSLARVIANDHVQNNMMLASIQAALAGAGPKIVCSESAAASTSISNLQYEKVIYPDGTTPPQVVVPNVVSTELLGEIQRRRTSAFAKAGINQAAAAGEKPAGLSSGKALREFVGIAAARLVTQQACYEKFWRDAARVIIMLAKKAYKSKPARVRAPGTDLIAQVSWADVNLTEDKYRISFSLLAGSGLSQSERLEDLNDLQQSGQIDIQDVLSHASNPDTQSLMDRVTAQRQRIYRIITMALKHAIPTPPSSDIDIPNMVAIGSQWMALAELRRDSGVYSEAGIECLRRTLANFKAKLQPPTPPVAAAPPPVDPMAQPPPGMPPEGAPPPDPMMAPAPMGAPVAA